jgi:ferritin
MLLSPAMVGALNAQIQHEMHNETKYRSVVTYFEDQNLRGWAKFFAAQAAGEYSHRQSIIDYLHEKNAHPVYLPVPQVDLFFPDLKALADFYYNTEVSTTKLLYQIAGQAQSEGDFGTFHWLRDLILEQNEEEAIALDLMEKIKRISGPDYQMLGLALEELDDEVGDLVG